MAVPPSVSKSSLPELSIFPAFTPDPIRLAELKGSSPYSPPVSPTRGEAQELFASIGKGQTFFELLEVRGLTLNPSGENPGNDRIDAIHCVDGRRRTLLHQACRCGNIQVAKCLLFHGANTSARCRDGRTPFHDTVSSCTGKTVLELLMLLFEHDPAGLSVVDANGSHVLHLAAIHGNLDVIQWCAGLEQPTGILSNFKSPRPTISRYTTHLGIASFSGRNMLHYAAYNGRLNVLKWLLGRDNPRREELSLEALDANGCSVLHYAAMGAPLEVCEWLVLEAPARHQLNLTARTTEGRTALELASARPSAIQHFLKEISRAPSVPSGLRCLGADTTSLGIGWDMEPTSNDTKLWETLKPLYFQVEICKKPASLSRASGFLTMFMLMPPTAPGSPRTPPVMSSALMSASYLHWKPLGVLLQPEAREHWLCGLDRDTEYLVRMRARNRNGFSGYSVPNLSGVFTTSDGGRRRSLSSLQRFFGAIKEDPPIETIALSFIGDLHFELLEARGLPGANSSTFLAMPTHVTKAQQAQHRRYYAVITIKTPSTPEVECSGNFCNSTRLIYCVRSLLATQQQDLILSGSSHAWRHPRFSLNTVFRVPESLAHSQVAITVHLETQGQNGSCCVGKISLSMLELVQGMPAKMQWLPLVNMIDSEMEGGLVLLRTLFLPNGVSELPHPTLPNTWGKTAEDLLRTSQELACGQNDDCSSPPRSCSSTTSTSSMSSTCSFQFSNSSMFTDRMGFGVFDPEIQLRNGEWQQIKQPPGVTRCYAYYKLFIEALEQQQEAKWCSVLAEHFSTNPQTCNVTDIHAPLIEATPVTTGIVSLIIHASKKHAVRELVWQGIPMSRRPELYAQMSGASVAQIRYPRDYFLSLIRRLEDPTDEVHSRPKNSRFVAAKKQIQADLKRTFAGNNGCWLISSTGQKSLEHVLLAYALHNDALGYCQSMTFVVGRLLCLCHSQLPSTPVDNLKESTDLSINNEERVFWLLLIICEKFFPTYYTQGMAGLHVDGGVLEKLLRMRLPKMHRHFQQLHAPPMGLVLVTQWLLPLCCAVFPSETNYRFLDVLFYEGSSVVFAMAIALLRISQHEIIAENVDYTQLFRFLRARDQRLHDAPLLMEITFEEHRLLGPKIDSLRQSVAQELGIQRTEKPTSTTMLSHLPVNELRPGDVDNCEAPQV